MPIGILTASLWIHGTSAATASMDRSSKRNPTGMQQAVADWDSGPGQAVAVPAGGPQIVGPGFSQRVPSAGACRCTISAVSGQLCLMAP